MFYMVINHFDQGYSHFNGSSIGYRRFPLAQRNDFLNEDLEHRCFCPRLELRLVQANFKNFGAGPQ